MSGKLRTNADRLLLVPVEVQPSHPARRRSYNIDPQGRPHALMGIGGITQNLRVGDPAIGWVADHYEPCVSSKNQDGDRNAAANFLACIGNVATVLSGDAKGDTGFVTGKHGGIEHILIDFPKKTIEALAYGDTIRIDTFGQGLDLLEFEDVKVMSLDPKLLDHPKWAIRREGDSLVVPVAKTIPAKIMGSGLGSDTTYQGDYDIQLFDETVVVEYGLADLRLGDIVAVLDADNSYGRIFRTGAVSIGIISHGACVQAGHGPGFTTLMTSASGAITPRMDASANIATILGAGKHPIKTDAKAPAAKKPAGKKPAGRKTK